ncbi:MAG: hypothetical protein MMC23_009868 [Stictis urceolatum]|nr:hypothetical protein [Stictis urceolata]
MKDYNEKVMKYNADAGLQKNVGCFDLKSFQNIYSTQHRCLRLHQGKLTENKRMMKSVLEGKKVGINDETYQKWTSSHRQVFHDLELLEDIEEVYSNLAKRSFTLCKERHYPDFWAWNSTHIDDGYPGGLQIPTEGSTQAPSSTAAGNPGSGGDSEAGNMPNPSTASRPDDSNATSPQQESIWKNLLTPIDGAATTLREPILAYHLWKV